MNSIHDDGYSYKLINNIAGERDSVQVCLCSFLLNAYAVPSLMRYADGY